MTDAELLALAAKAHGNLTYVADCDGWIHETPDGQRGAWWNPLTSDADAFRLAVKLGISVNQACDRVSADRIGFLHWWEQYGGDPFAATRRAITRMAAAIGKGMP